MNVSMISQVVREFNLLKSWVEGQEIFSVSRHVNGRPGVVKSRTGRWPKQECAFQYDSHGNFVGMDSPLISDMISALLAEANGTVTASTDLTGGSIVSTPNSTLKLPVGTLDLSGGVGGAGFKTGPFTGLPVLAAAVKNAMSGVSDAVVLQVGDSTYRGVGSGGLGTGQFVAGMSQMVSAGCHYAPSACENVLGRAGVVIATYDDRVSEGGWSTLSQTLGGEAWQASSAVTDWSFTPKTPVSEIDVYYIGSPGAGRYDVKVDGRVVTTINCNQSTAGLYKQRISVPLGMHVIAAAWKTTNAYHAGIDCWDGRSKKVRFLNAGRSGWKTADWIGAGSGWSPFNALGAPGSHLIDISLGINDVINGVATATTHANLLSLTNKALATGANVTLTTPNPILAYDSQMDALAAAYVAVAEATGAKLIDYYTSVGGRTTGMPTGAMADSLHPSIIGYAHKRDYWLAQVSA